MSLWVAFTLTAAAVQTVRFMLQKQLAGRGLSTGAVTFARFLFAVPFAVAVAMASLSLAGAAMPATGLRFWAFALGGGLAQIIATLCLVALFSLRNFAVGVAFTKTETMLVAVFSALILAEPVSRLGWAAILIGFVGVVLLARGPPRQFDAKATALGLCAGAFFGLSAIGYRGATIELLPLDFFTRAALTLAIVTAAQTFAMALYLRWARPGDVTRVVREWRRTALIGLTGMLGSLCWFAAFALQNAAYVRALGQVEIVFTLIVSALVFHERLGPREALGIALVVGSLVLIVLPL